MRHAVVVLVLALCASQAVAWSYSENFNTYSAGTPSWGSGGKWTEPTNGLKLDYYSMDNTLAPRTGNSGTRTAQGVVAGGGSVLAMPSFSADFLWSNYGCALDAFFVVLSDTAADGLAVPADGSSLASPIHAIAWGHAADGNTDYSFFDGQKWTVVGSTTAGIKSAGKEVVQGMIDPAGNWSVKTWSPTAGYGTPVTGALAAGDFTVSSISVISVGNSSGVYSGIDNINVPAVPEPASIALLLGLGILFVRRRGL